MAAEHDPKQEDRPFLRRWSDRKRAAGAPATEAEETPRDLQADGAGQDETPVEMSEEEIEAKLAEIEQMKQGDDFKPLIKTSMPEAIRRAALRRLWRANPILGFRDGLNDYDLDYTNAAMVVENLKTAYKVGKGYLTGEENEKKEAAEAVESAGDEALETAPETQSKEIDGDASGVADERDAAERADGHDEPADKAELPNSAQDAPESDPEAVLQGQNTEELQDVKPGHAASRRWNRFKTV